MVVAVDVKTGAVVGQVLDQTPQETLDRDPEARSLYLILGAAGYSTVPATTVRLEKVS